MPHPPAATRPTRTVRSEVSRGRTTLRAARDHRDPREAVFASAAATVNVAAALGDRAGLHRAGCPACGWSGSRFRAKGNIRGITWSSECPACGAAARHRGLTLLLPTVAEAPGRILHFAPEPTLSTLVRRLFPDATVETTDLERTDVDHPGQDIQALDLPSGAFDLVLCNHVLEHVPDDEAAMAELARITAPDGCTVVTIPGDWNQDRTRAFDPPDANGHFRHYGRDVVRRLSTAFATVETAWCDELPRPSDQPNPRLRHEPIYLCRP